MKKFIILSLSLFFVGLINAQDDTHELGTNKKVPEMKLTDIDGNVINKIIQTNSDGVLILDNLVILIFLGYSGYLLQIFSHSYIRGYLYSFLNFVMVTRAAVYTAFKASVSLFRGAGMFGCFFFLSK